MKEINEVKGLIIGKDIERVVRPKQTKVHKRMFIFRDLPEVVTSVIR